MGRRSLKGIGTQERCRETESVNLDITMNILSGNPSQNNLNISVLRDKTYNKFGYGMLLAACDRKLIEYTVTSIENRKILRIKL